MARHRQRSEPTIGDPGPEAGSGSRKPRATVGEELARLAGSLTGRGRKPAPDQPRRRSMTLDTEASAPPAGRPPDETMSIGIEPRSGNRQTWPTVPPDGEPVSPGRPTRRRRPMPRRAAEPDDTVKLHDPPRRPLRPEPRKRRKTEAPVAAPEKRSAAYPPQGDGVYAGPLPPGAVPPGAVPVGYLPHMPPFLPSRPWHARVDVIVSGLAVFACVATVGIVVFLNMDRDGRNQDRLRLEELAAVAETRFENARIDLATANERREKVESDISGLQQQRLAVQSELSRLRDRRDDMVGEVHNLEAELGANRQAKAQADAIAAQRTEAEVLAVRARQQEQLQRLEQQHAAALEEARSTNASELRRLRNQLAAARKEAETATKDAEAAKAAIARSVGLSQSHAGDLRAFVVDRFIEKVTVVATQAQLIVDYAETVARLAREYENQNLPMPGDALAQYFVGKETVRQFLSATPTGKQIVDSQLQNREFALLPQAEASALREDIRTFVANNGDVFNAPLGIRVQSTVSNNTLVRQLQIADANYRRLLQTLQLLRSAIRSG